MRLYLCRDTSSEISRFIVLDDLGREKYKITGNHSVITSSLYIYDTTGVRLMKIRCNAESLPLSIYSFGKDNKGIRLLFNQVSNKFSFSGISWRVTGAYPFYRVVDADKSIILRQSCSFKPKNCIIDILSENRELLCLGIAACINYAPMDLELNGKIAAANL